MNEQAQDRVGIDPRPERRRWPLVVLVLLLALTVWLATVPAVARMPQVHRWGLHATLLLALTGSLVVALRLSFGLSRRWWRELGLALLLALFIEGSQIFFPLHDPEYKGLIANVCGVVAALVMVAAIDGLSPVFRGRKILRTGPSYPPSGSFPRESGVS